MNLNRGCEEIGGVCFDAGGIAEVLQGTKYLQHRKILYLFDYMLMVYKYIIIL